MNLRDYRLHITESPLGYTNKSKISNTIIAIMAIRVSTTASREAVTMSEKVLIVDDEAMMAQAVAEGLTEDGYT